MLRKERKFQIFSFPLPLSHHWLPRACDPEGRSFAWKLEEQAEQRAGEPHPRCLSRPLVPQPTQGSVVTQIPCSGRRTKKEEAQDTGRPRGSTGSRGAQPGCAGQA